MLQTNINTHNNTHNNNGDSTKTYDNNNAFDTCTHSEIIHTAFDNELWERIAALAFDPPDARLTFASRLVRETGWTPTFAAQAIDEYRRFLYLAVRAGHPVTPSQQVDEVWHLHLMCTRHYWGVLCREVLRYDLHHGPSLGGPAESAKYHDRYERTLASYTRVFGAPPPAALWPTSQERFQSKSTPASANLASHWIIAKPIWWRNWSRGSKLKWLTLSGLVTLALAAPPTASGLADSGQRYGQGADFTVIVLSLLGAIGAFQLLRFCWETPSDRKVRLDRQASDRRRQAGGSMSSGGCGGGSSDSDASCGGGCGGGCSCS